MKVQPNGEAGFKFVDVNLSLDPNCEPKQYLLHTDAGNLPCITNIALEGPEDVAAAGISLMTDYFVLEYPY
jgi:hypothetical protein